MAVDRDYWIMLGGIMCHVCLCYKKKVVPWLESYTERKGGQEGEHKRGAVSECGSHGKDTEAGGECLQPGWHTC